MKNNGKEKVIIKSKKNIDFEYKIVKTSVKHVYANAYNFQNSLIENFNDLTDKITLPLHLNQELPLGSNEFCKVVRTFKDGEPGAIYIFDISKNDNEIKKTIELNNFIKHKIIFVNYTNVIKASPFEYHELSFDENSVLVLVSFNESCYLNAIKLYNSTLVIDNNILSASALNKVHLDSTTVFFGVENNNLLLCHKCYFKSNSPKHAMYFNGNVYKKFYMNLDISSEDPMCINVNNSVSFDIETAGIYDCITNKEDCDNLSNVLNYLSNLNINRINYPMFGFDNIDKFKNSNLILDTISLPNNKLTHVVWVKTMYRKNNKTLFFLEPFVCLDKKYVSVKKISSILLAENSFSDVVAFETLSGYINSVNSHIKRLDKDIILVV